MVFPHHILEEIKARIPLSMVVGREVSLRQRSPNDFWGISPFTQEKTPSFHVRDDGGYYHCFATGEHGDHFTWLMQRQNLSFMEAIQQLAEEAGITLPSPDPEAAQKREQEKNLYEVLEFVTAWFQNNLTLASASAAREMIKQRKLTKESISVFKIGYAPEDGQALIKAAKAANIDQDLLIEAGLLRPSDDPNKAAWPLFRNRLMFPIEDVRGRVIAFGGRFIGDSKAAGVGKYINSPQTPLFNKSYNLYNFGTATKLAHKSNRLLVAEGYMDVIALWQAGFGEAIAPLGTAITATQLGMMWRIVDKPTLCLDGDSAGRAAAIRAGQLALQSLSPGKSLAFSFLPLGEDPDSLIIAQGAAAMEKLITQALPIEQVLIENEAIGIDLAKPEQKARLEQKLEALTNLIKDETVKKHYRFAFRNLFWQLIKGGQIALSHGKGQGSFTGAKAYGKKFAGAPLAPSLGSRLKSHASHSARRVQEAVLAIMLTHNELLNQYEDQLGTIEFDPDLDKLRVDLQIGIEGQFKTLIPSEAERDTNQPQILTDKDKMKHYLKTMGHSDLLEQLEGENLYALVPQARQEAPISTAKEFLNNFFEQQHQSNLRKDALRQVGYYQPQINDSENNQDESQFSPNKSTQYKDNQKIENRLKQYQASYASGEASIELEVDRLTKQKLEGN